MSRLKLLSMYQQLFGVHTAQLAAEGLKDAIEQMRTRDQPGWGYLIGLETFAPPSDLTFEGVYRGTIEWLTPVGKFGRMYFDSAALDVVSNLFTRVEYAFDPVHFFSPGVTTFGKATGRLVPNKTARAIIQWDEIENMLHSEPHVFYRPFVKRERAKARLVISASDECFISQVPVAVCAEKGYRSDGIHHIFALEPPEQQLAIVAEIQQLLGRGWYAHSIDYKSFDHLPSRNAIRSALTMLLSKTGYEFTYDWVEAQLSGVAKVAGFPVIKHISGIPSGWRLTSIMDSVINMAVAISVFGPKVPIVTHGDDCVVLTPFPLDPSALTRAFDEHGAIINTYKSALNADWCEFLKTVIDANSIMYYPARALPALCLRQAWQDYTYDDREYITSQLKTISTLLSRGARDCDVLYSRLIDEFGHDARTWREALRTPARFGLGTGGFTPRHPVFERRRVKGQSELGLVTNLPLLRQLALNDIYKSVGAMRHNRYRFRGFAMHQVSILPTLGPRARYQPPPVKTLKDRFLFFVWLRSTSENFIVDVGFSKTWWKWNCGGYPAATGLDVTSAAIYNSVALGHNSRAQRSFFRLCCDATALRLQSYSLSQNGDYSQLFDKDHLHLSDLMTSA